MGGDAMTKKRALLYAIIVGVGAAVGRLSAQFTNPPVYNVPWPDLFVQVTLCFFVPFLAYFSTYVFVEWIKNR